VYLGTVFGLEFLVGTSDKEKNGKHQDSYLLHKQLTTPKEYA